MLLKRQEAKMNYEEILPSSVLHWNYRGLTEFPIQHLQGEESEVTDIYLKENLISKLPNAIGQLVHLESLYISGNDITELPKEISNLKCLKCLDVSGNRLKRIPNEIGEVRSLKFLILDENELTELPLRLVEMRYLRYLSVCDNKLKWLPQRPVFNYHHCELRFWRNPQLKSLPYSLWYHMFRNQQTRSLNIACLNYSNAQTTRGFRCRLKFIQDSKEWNFDIDCPPQYTNIITSGSNSPPSLYELSKRRAYKCISETAQGINTKYYRIYTYSGPRSYNYNSENNNVTHLQNDFNSFNIKNANTVNDRKSKEKEYYVPGDILDEHFNFLPSSIKDDLVNGPVSICENAGCKNPVFNHVYYEFTIGKLLLIDGIQEVVLSAAFCSKKCADTWKVGNVKTIPWTVIEE